MNEERITQLKDEFNKGYAKGYALGMKQILEIWDNIRIKRRNKEE